MKRVLAIRGDYHEGNEVIKILEMLGGVNSKNLDGTADRYFYFICPHTSIIKNVFEEQMLITQWETHSLKSFKREYPYKTGDKLVIFGRESTILETFWSGFTIKYKIYNGLYLGEYSAEQLKSAINESKEENTDCEETTTISPLEIYENIYEGLEYLEEIGYPLDNMTYGELKKLLYKKIVG